MLAHEVKNPLSGIRGAAQLLEQDADPAERELTQLICDETDRIVALVDRMEAFSDHRPIEDGVLDQEPRDPAGRPDHPGGGRGVGLGDVVDRVPSLGSTAARIRQDMVDQRLHSRQYTRDHGQDPPEITNWVWPSS